jgi:hypothetical protein
LPEYADQIPDLGRLLEMSIEASLFTLIRRPVSRQRHEWNLPEHGVRPEAACDLIPIRSRHPDVGDNAIRLEPFRSGNRVETIIHGLDIETAHLQESSEKPCGIDVVFDQKYSAAPSTNVHSRTIHLPSRDHPLDGGLNTFSSITLQGMPGSQPAKPSILE